MIAGRTAKAADTSPGTTATYDEPARKLVSRLLSGASGDFRPQFDFASDLGFTYPVAEQVLGAPTEAALSSLETLSERGILKKSFFDRLIRCPQCNSMNLRPTTHCPKCGSANLVRGRVLEHIPCKYVGVEDEFLVSGRYICPKCKLELHSIGVDFQSLGLLRKCNDCSEIFSVPALKWRCLKCSSISAEDKVKEVNIFSYSLDEARRSRLEFDISPKDRLVEFLKGRGYEVVENARMKGRSGAEHRLDMLASRDDGIVTHHIAIGIEVAAEKIGLEKIFSFDDKTYDIGIHDKIMIVIPDLEREAETFASQQRIKVLEVTDLESVLGRGAPQSLVPGKAEPFQFKSRSQLIAFLIDQGYQVAENAAVKGRSGAEHRIDLLATRDDGIVVHRIAIGVETGTEKIGLDRVFSFDDKTYDVGIRDKVFVAVPGLTREAGQFADRQRIRVFEAKELEPGGSQQAT